MIHFFNISVSLIEGLTYSVKYLSLFSVIYENVCWYTVPFCILQRPDYTGQQISKHFFVSAMNMLLIYLFVSMKL